MTDESMTPPDAPTARLHAAVRQALAVANPAAKAMGSTLLQSSLDPAEPGVGPAPLRRLYIFYAHGQASGLGEEQVRADLEWLAEHFDVWVARQEQAQRDARDLFTALKDTCPLPTADNAEEDPAVAMLQQAQALRAARDHWLHQPWSQRLMGRWTEDLPDAVTAARQWLAARSAKVTEQSSGEQPNAT